VKKRSILVVDDEENVAETIKMVLEQEGYRATTAYTAEAAITPLRHTKFSAVITDLNMEKQDIGLVNPKAYRFIAMAEADHRLGLNVRLLFRYGTFASSRRVPCPCATSRLFSPSVMTLSC